MSSLQTLLLATPLAIVIVISIIAYQKASLKETNDLRFFTKLKIFCYRKIYTSVTLLGVAFFIVSISVRDHCCLADIEKTWLFLIGTLIGLSGGIMASIGISFKEKESAKIEDEEKGELGYDQGAENVAWSPKVIYRFAVAYIVFTATYMMKLVNKFYTSVLDSIDIGFLLASIGVFITGIVYLVKWFKIYSKDTRKSEVLNISLLICVFVFPYSLFISYYEYIFNIVSCLLFSKFWH